MDSEKHFKAVQELRMIARFYAQRGYHDKANEVSGLILRIDNSNSAHAFASDASENDGESSEAVGT